MNRKSQITLFIILGLVLFFTVIFLYSALSSLEAARLQKEKQKIVKQVFTPKALQMFTDECLAESLKDALKTLGKQGGRFWKGQPGGFIPFSEDRGINYNSENISYGITFDEKDFPQFANGSWPCPKNNLGSFPDFCHYSFPNLSLSQLPLFTSQYGVLPSASALLKQLSNYIKNKSIECAGSYLKSYPQQNIEIIYGDIKITPSLSYEALVFQINFPFHLKPINEEKTYFHMENFNLKQEGKFRDAFFLIEKLFVADTKYLDFDFSPHLQGKENFTYLSDKNNYNCQELNGIYNCTERFPSWEILNNFKKESLGNNEVFIFNFSISIDTENWLFQIARQNRPPVLDYISRFPGKASQGGYYDYLVIAGLDNELGWINITASALDPDENKLNYGFGGNIFDAFSFIDDKGNKVNEDTFSDNRIIKNKTDGTKHGFYNLTVNVTDDYLNDWQLVRILVDQKPEINFILTSPYPNFENNLSLEDPIFLNLTKKFFSDNAITNFTILINGKEFLSQNKIEQKCYPLPNTTKNCSEFNFTNNFIDILTINTSLKEWGFADNTMINISFNLTYGTYQFNFSEEKNFNLAQCIPYQNKDYPLPNPFHNFNYSFGYFLKELKTKLINPFFANHSCCKSDGAFASNTSPCFFNWTFHTESNSIYLQIINQTVFCSGQRGNLCNGIQTVNHFNLTVKDLEEYKKLINHTIFLDYLSTTKIIVNDTLYNKINITFNPNSFICTFVIVDSVNESCRGIPANSTIINITNPNQPQILYSCNQTCQKVHPQ